MRKTICRNANHEQMIRMESDKNKRDEERKPRFKQPFLSKENRGWREEGERDREEAG